MKIKKEISNEWKKEIKSEQINYYLSNSIWKNEIPDLNLNHEYKTLNSYLLGIRELIKFYEENKILESYINTYFHNYWANLKGYWNSIEKYCNESEDNNYSFNNIKDLLQYLKNNLENIACFTKKSWLWKQIKASKINNHKLLKGFLRVYQQSQFNYNEEEDEEEEINGFVIALQMNKSLSVPAPSKVFNDIILKHQERDKEIDAKISEMRQTIDDFKKTKKLVLENFESQFSRIKINLEKQKQKLMLSGPLQILYKKLEDYTGHKYIKLKENEFLYKKELKKNQFKHSKIYKYGLLSFLWGVFGMILVFGLFMAIYFITPEKIDNNSKLIIMISVVGSFVMFIYGYILRVLVKNWNSAKHISEKLEDRISLVQLYLSILQENNMTSESKIYAIKEIFKSIDTGLIKESILGNPLINSITK